MKDLEDLRREIDLIDRQIVELFEERMKTVSQVAEYKIKNQLPVLNSSREASLIEKNISHLRDKKLAPYLEDFYRSFMNISKDYQKSKMEGDIIKNVCFQGTKGSYSEEALYEYFGEDVKTYPVKEFEDVFKYLKEDSIDYGVLPIENSSTGAITEVYDLLRKYGLYVVGNMTLKIDHNLMGVESAELKDIDTLYSHPQAFKQCSNFLEGENFQLLPYHNTALSAELVREKNLKNIGAIGSKRAADLNRLKILKTDINNSDSNYTRFIIIGKKLEASYKDDAISLVFSSPDRVGALYDNLGIFKENNLNMIRIESRPLVGKPWEYFFYIDFEGHISDPQVERALDFIKENSSYFKLLGSYRREF